MKINQVIDLYLSELKSVKRYSPNTIKSYREDLLGFLSFCQANQKNDIENITNKFIKHFLMHLNELGLDKVGARKLHQYEVCLNMLFKNIGIKSGTSNIKP
jgi:site-specific recombinase XerD